MYPEQSPWGRERTAHALTGLSVEAASIRSRPGRGRNTWVPGFVLCYCFWRYVENGGAAGEGADSSAESKDGFNCSSAERTTNHSSLTAQKGRDAVSRAGGYLYPSPTSPFLLSVYRGGRQRNEGRRKGRAPVTEGEGKEGAAGREGRREGKGLSPWQVGSREPWFGLVDPWRVARGPHRVTELIGARKRVSRAWS